MKMCQLRKAELFIWHSFRGIQEMNFQFVLQLWGNFDSHLNCGLELHIM